MRGVSWRVLAVRARSQWWVGYMLGANENYLTKGPGSLDPRYEGSHPGSPCCFRTGSNPCCGSAALPCSQQAARKT